MQPPHVLDEDRRGPRGNHIPCHKSTEDCKDERLRSGPWAETCPLDQALTLSGCVTCGKLHSLSEPPFFSYTRGDIPIATL